MASGLTQGTGLTRWPRKGPCLLMGFASKNQDITFNLREMDEHPDVSLTEGSDPVTEVMLPSGDAGFGIDNKSWMADPSVLQDTF